MFYGGIAVLGRPRPLAGISFQKVGPGRLARRGHTLFHRETESLHIGFTWQNESGAFEWQKPAAKLLFKYQVQGVHPSFAHTPNHTTLRSCCPLVRVSVFDRPTHPRQIRRNAIYSSNQCTTGLPGLTLSVDNVPGKCLASRARHVMGCHRSRETRVESALVDAARRATSAGPYQMAVPTPAQFGHRPRPGQPIARSAPTRARGSGGAPVSSRVHDYDGVTHADAGGPLDSAMSSRFECGALSGMSLFLSVFRCKRAERRVVCQARASEVSQRRSDGGSSNTSLLVSALQICAVFMTG